MWDSISVCFSFQISAAIDLVRRMKSQEDRIQAIELWNEVSERLQDVVSEELVEEEEEREEDKDILPSENAQVQKVEPAEENEEVTFLRYLLPTNLILSLFPLMEQTRVRGVHIRPAPTVRLPYIAELLLTMQYNNALGRGRLAVLLSTGLSGNAGRPSSATRGALFLAARLCPAWHGWKSSWLHGPPCLGS